MNNEQNAVKIPTVINETLKAQAAELQAVATARKEKLLKRAVPQKRTLENSLATLTKAALEDIAFNVGLTIESGEKKADIIVALAAAIRDFSSRWFTTIVDEQYNALRHLTDNDGLAKDFREDEMRLDFFTGIGVAFGAGQNGKLVWYLPDEIITEFKKFGFDSLQKAVQFNTDVLRLATGVLYYYGVLNHEELYNAVCRYLGEEVEMEAGFDFAAFMGILMNGSCWAGNIKIDRTYAAYYTAQDPAAIYEANHSRAIPYAKLPYNRIYDAGEDNYIDSTEAYKTLAQFVMQEFGCDVLKAAEIVGKTLNIWQNGGTVEDGFKQIADRFTLSYEQSNRLLSHVIQFNLQSRLWSMGGHCPSEIMSGSFDETGDNIFAKPVPKVAAPAQKETDTDKTGETVNPQPDKPQKKQKIDKRKKKPEPAAEDTKQKKKIGPNDPCPCGSGKKYKKCCMRKEQI